MPIEASVRAKVSRGLRKNPIAMLTADIAAMAHMSDVTVCRFSEPLGKRLLIAPLIGTRWPLSAKLLRR